MASDLNVTALTQNHYAKDFTQAPPCLPVIDFSELDGPQHDQVIETIVKAAENIGFFQVVNHGVPVEILEELKDSMHRFFSQTEEEKQLVIPKEGSPTPPLALYFKQPMTGLQNLALVYTDEQDALKYWPDACKEAALQYQKLSSKLAERILQILMSYLGLSLDESMLDSYLGDSSVFMNYFTPYPSEIHADATVGKHTDLSTLTVLLQDHVGGLYAELSENGDLANNYKGVRAEIKPIPGALIVFVGDSLQVLSNGRYVATEHYVDRGGKGTRASSPAFFYPKKTTVLGPVAQAVEKDGGRSLYRELLFGEYWEIAMNMHKSLSPGRKAIHHLEMLPKE